MPPKLTPFLPLAAVLALGAATLHAADPAPAMQADSDSKAYHPFTVDAGLGIFTGPGVGVGWRFADNFGVHAGVNYFKYSGNGSVEDVTYNASVRLMTEQFTVDVYPWKAHSFRISLGAALNQNRFSGNTTSASFTLNGNTYPGTLSLNIKQQPVDPYLSVGGNLFYFDDAHHWAMTGELGAFYAGKAKVNMTSSNPAAAADVASQQAKVQKYADKLKVWPVLRLGFSFSF